MSCCTSDLDDDENDDDESGSGTDPDISIGELENPIPEENLRFRVYI